MLKKHKRDRLGLINDILSVLLEGKASKTMLAHRANLDNHQLNKYLDILLDARFVRYEDKKGKKAHIRITDEGVRFTFIYKELMYLLNRLCPEKANFPYCS